MSELRDPRIDPQPGDKVRSDYSRNRCVMAGKSPSMIETRFVTAILDPPLLNPPVPAFGVRDLPRACKNVPWLKRRLPFGRTAAARVQVSFGPECLL